ncbi:MAG: hypothetical protein ACK4UY_04170 [Dietzia sp.]
MDIRTDYLDHLAGQFTGLSDHERLDQAAAMAATLTKLTDLLATGDLDASVETQAAYAGAVWALEEIAAGRAQTATEGGDSDA